MRFLGRMPDNPWPQDMVIRVDDTPHHLTILLFIRHAWGVAADADVPPLDPLPDIGASRCATPDPGYPAAGRHPSTVKDLRACPRLVR